jgi:hypothetical protein
MFAVVRTRSSTLDPLGLVVAYTIHRVERPVSCSPVDNKSLVTKPFGRR